MIYINGRFLTQKITGVQRYAIEVIKELDKLNIKEKIVILHPKNVINNLKLKNIEMCQIGDKQGHIWEQITLPLYILKNKKNAKLINFCNLAPIMFPGYVVIHDIAFKTHPEHLNWKFSLWYRIVTKLNIKRYKHIFTVSKFSKSEILENYKVKDENITVTYNSANHLKEIVPDKSIIKKLNLENKEFCFSLGSKSPHKNHKYIEQCAKNNPNMIFVVSGTENKIFREQAEEDIENLIFTGYLTDNELVALYKTCKCFIFPSLYEGFGIPPLEALTLGCNNVIVSDIDVFKEIYDNNVQYVNVEDKNVCINIKDNINNCDNIHDSLENKYSWENIMNIIINVIGGINEDKV